MSYTSNKAPARENPVSDRIQEAAGSQASASNQEKQIPQSSKFRNVGTASGASNQLRTQANTKGTGVVGRPSSIGLESKKRALPAVENPDGQRNRDGNAGHNS